uniref:kynurenine--oxoglutarate transaminase 1 isoform X3 n=1 Tax=Podarcis muralis TaxID=64176 RepID=UPI0010A041E8|nr:kynurenine--oxoglutarate transaminase 1 isoform X3 [Podarcis muralis]
MVRSIALSLIHYLLGRNNRIGFCWYHSKAKMSRMVQARRLEGVEKNIWVEFVKLAATYKTVNLGQGFPNFPPPDFVREALVEAVGGENTLLHQYTREFGHPRLVAILARFFGKLLERDLDPLKNVMVTVGAYEALFCCFQALVDDGDEVIIIEPYFDCYEPMVKMAGGTSVFIPLQLVFSRKEMELIAELCVRHDVLCFSDEVYEWLVYDGNKHIRMASLPGMWERTVTIGSAGKTFSATGWKVGWTIGPDHLLKHLRTIHQNSVYHCATAAQEAVACGLEQEFERFGKPESYFAQLPQRLQRKRDFLVQSLLAVGMKPIIPEGSYFVVADLSEFKDELPDEPDSEEPYDYRFTKWMIKNKGLTAIPVSAFFSPPQKKNFDHLIRFCFAKEDSTLEAADSILQQWSRKTQGQ